VEQETAGAVLKWGCYGGNGRCNVYQNRTLQTADSFVPLSWTPAPVLGGKIPKNHQMMWQNSRYVFTKFCKGIKVIFENESQAVVYRATGCVVSKEKALLHVWL
jgi:hypothetical protein